MTEAQALAYLAGAGRFGELGLARTEALLRGLGHPERAMRFYHVAGTNGKGSVTAALACLLEAGGRQTGRFISPHLERPHERVAVQGSPISGGELAAATEAVARAAAGAEDPPTEFELWTALALFHFRRRGVTDVAWETGLGGRHDATNVVTPEVSLITSIALDHTDRLGATLEAIAWQKAGIVKPGRPLVVGRLPPPALRVVEQAARAAGAQTWRLGREIEIGGVRLDRGGTAFAYRDPCGEIARVRTGLVGAHQAGNAALAIAALRLGGADVTPEGLAALADLCWPGRFEILGGDPLFVLDGAHNAEGVRALRETWDLVLPGVRPVLLFGCLADRDPRALTEPFRQDALALHVAAPPGHRAQAAAEIAARVGGVAHESPAAALASATQAARRLGAPLLAYGSLYLIGALRSLRVGAR